MEAHLILNFILLVLFVLITTKEQSTFVHKKQLTDKQRNGMTDKRMDKDNGGLEEGPLGTLCVRSPEKTVKKVLYLVIDISTLNHSASSR